ncbi:MAG: cbb3-type cytochrome c oxidase subunit I [Verrucomicrobia bacterium]|nr:cbb3-type cytochrome c oxidase subunit I [Verrucomicrobiota bacterium]
MINAPTRATTAEVTAIDTQARGPLLLLVGSGLGWLVASGIFALITSIQLHSPGFMADCSWLTHGRAEALRETAFIYGWAANAGLALGLWVLGRLGGSPLRALNWAVVGTVFWNLGVIGGLIGIATGDMTSFAHFQLPRYVQPAMLLAYGAIAVPGVLAWSGRRTDGTYASQWYAVAALFLFPWLFSAAQVVLLWAPVRGTLQAIAAGWYAQSLWACWLAPMALAGAYYVVPKVAGRVLPSYDFAPLGFWTLIFVGTWTGGRHLVGGPVPAWIATIAVVACAMLLFHYMVVTLNLRGACGTSGTAIRFIRFGLVAYVLTGALDALTSFRSVAVDTQFTFLASALEQLGLSGGVSMMLFGGIYFMVPRLTGRTWASSALADGHRWFVMTGVVVLIGALAVAGWTQADALLDAKVALSDIFGHVRLPLLVASGAQLLVLGANLLFLVHFCQSACACCLTAAPAENPFRQPSTLEAPAS